MSLTFSQAKSKLANWLNRNDLSSFLGDFINMSMHRIEKTDNFNCMLNLDTGTVTSSDDTITEPTRYKETDALLMNISNQDVLIWKDTWKHLLTHYPLGSNAKEAPKQFARRPSEGDFIVRPYPDTTYAYQHHYWAYTADLSGDSDSNFWTNSAWEILLYGAMVEALLFIKAPVEEINGWASLQQRFLADLLSAEKKEKMSPPQAMRSPYVV